MFLKYNSNHFFQKNKIKKITPKVVFFLNLKMPNLKIKKKNLFRIRVPDNRILIGNL